MKRTAKHNENISKGMRRYYANESEEHREQRRQNRAKAERSKNVVYSFFLENKEELRKMLDVIDD